MLQKNDAKLPRLYLDQALKERAKIPLPAAQAHYLVNVMRRRTGDAIRLFNGRDGEWRALLEVAGKKDVLADLQELLRPGLSEPPREIHLVFAPVKKARMDFMIEKATELGATHFHPVLTRHTEVRSLNENRLRQQIIEAAEQCERLDIPHLAPLQKFTDICAQWPEDIPLYAALARGDYPLLKKVAASHGPAALLTGPEGGFEDNETQILLQMRPVVPVSLGANILRAETAALAGLCAFVQA